MIKKHHEIKKQKNISPLSYPNISQENALTTIIMEKKKKELIGSINKFHA